MLLKVKPKKYIIVKAPRKEVGMARKIMRVLTTFLKKNKTDNPVSRMENRIAN